MTARSLNPALTHARVCALLKAMIRSRRFEDRCGGLYTRQKICGVLQLYDGEDAIAALPIPHLEDKDRIVATYREGRIL